MAFYPEGHWLSYLDLSSRSSLFLPETLDASQATAEAEAESAASYEEESWLDLALPAPALAPAQRLRDEERGECCTVTSPGHSPTPTDEPEKPLAPAKPDKPADPPQYAKADAYPVVLGSFCALFASFGWRSGSGLFQDYYQHNQLRDSSPSTIAWINSIGFFLIYFGAVIVSPLNQRFGARKVLLAGSVLHVGGLLGASFSSTFYQFFLSQGVCSSLGASALFFTSVTTVGRWFNRNQALTIGISASGTSAGGVVFPLMIEHLLPRLGFTWTFRAVVLLVIVLVTVAIVTIRPPPPSASASNRRQPPPITSLKARLAPFRDRTFVLTVVGIALFSSGYFVTLTFVVSVARLRGWTDVIDAIVVLNGASFFGRILPGLAADRVGRFNTMIVLSFLSTLLIFALWLPGNSVHASIAFSAVFGFTSGCTVSLGPSMMFQISHLRIVTWNIALLYVVQSAMALVTSPIGGALLSVGRGPLYLQAYCGAITGLGTILFVLARLQQSGCHLWKKV